MTCTGTDDPDVLIIDDANPLPQPVLHPLDTVVSASHRVHIVLATRLAVNRRAAPLRRAPRHRTDQVRV